MQAKSLGADVLPRRHLACHCSVASVRAHAVFCSHTDALTPSFRFCLLQKTKPKKTHIAAREGCVPPAKKTTEHRSTARSIGADLPNQLPPGGGPRRAATVQAKGIGSNF